MRLPKWCYVGLLVIVASGCKSKPPAPTRADLIKQGDDLVAKGQYLAAANAYVEAARNGPPDGELLLKAARANMRTGRLRLATEAAVRAADALPDDTAAQLYAASLMLTQKRYDEVKDRMRTLLRKNPKHINALIEFGNATQHLENYVAAILQFVRARDKDEFDGMAVKSHAGGDRFNPGLTKKDDDDAEAAFRTAIEVDPALPRSQLALANFLWWAGRADEAEPVLKRVADEHPGQRVANLALGAYYRLLHRNDEAERYLKVAGKEEGSGGGRDLANFALVDLYMETKRDEEALALLNSLSADQPVLAGLRLAEVEFRTGKRDEAVRRVDAMLAQQPPPPRAALAKAQFLVAMGEPVKAVPFARTAVAADPTSDETRAALGQALFAAGDLESAFDEYKEAVRLNPRSADLSNQLARASLALGQQKDALQFARDAARLKPGDRTASLAVVRALVLAGDLVHAEQELKPMIAKEPAAPDLIAATGMIDQARGNDEAARAAFTKALELAPDSLEALSGIVSLDLKQKRNSAARQRVDAAFAAHQNDVVFLLLAARVYSAENDTARFESTLRQLLDRRPHAVAERYALAQLAEKGQRTDEARKLYETVVAEATGPEWAAIRSRAAARKSALDVLGGQ